MRVFYFLSTYISHRLAGLEYIACLEALGHELIFPPARPAGADVAILHEDPLALPGIFERYPELAGMRSVGYCVWECAQLSPFYREPAQLVKEIWTPSGFSRNSFAAWHRRVSVLPHVVQRIAPGREAMQRMAGLLGMDVPQKRGAPFYFFSVMDAVNPRKNLQGLLAAFRLVRASLSPRPFLVIKQYRLPFDLSGQEGVISIDQDLSPEEMAALHALCGAYVSAHHCEGWGLGLSEAMAFGKPVIATGYSGNMEFMNQENSLPIPYTLEPVSEEMTRRIPLFTRDMVWARPDPAALGAAMKRAAQGRLPAQLGARAARITREFGPEAVAGRLRALLEA